MSFNPVQEALDHLRKVGWTQNWGCNDRGEVCALGAVCLETPITNADASWDRDETFQRANICEPYLAHVIREQYPDFVAKHAAAPYTDRDSTLIFRWNDADGRTQAEVESVFEKAAANYERDHARK